MANIITIEKILLKEHSKKQTMKIVKHIGNNQNRFNDLLNLLFNNNYIITQRASWAISLCVEQHPDLIKPHLKKIIKNLKNPVHDAVKRHTLRMLQQTDIPKALMGETADTCFKLLSSSQEPIAIKVFSMSVIYNITLKEPDLKNELRMILENQMPYASPGFLSRGNKILKLLNKKGPLI